jgi:hypothetical protein
VGQRKASYPVRAKKSPSAYVDEINPLCWSLSLLFASPERDRVRERKREREENVWCKSLRGNLAQNEKISTQFERNFSPLSLFFASSSPNLESLEDAI